MAITRTPMVDDDGTGTTGTIINNAWKQEFYNQIDAAVATQGDETEFLLIGSGGTYHNYALSATKRIHCIACVGSSDVTFSGFANGRAGDRLIISNAFGDTSRNVWLLNNNSGSTANNRLMNFATSGPTPLAGTAFAVGGIAVYINDSQQNAWRLVSHEQGGWITPVYSAAGFTGSAATWTVEAGDMTTLRYVLRGRSLTVAYALSATAVSGATPELRIGNSMYGSFTAASSIYAPAALGFNAGTRSPSHITSNATYLALKKVDDSSWAADVGSSYFYGQITFDVN
jgi:hypothetical protein